MENRHADLLVNLCHEVFNSITALRGMVDLLTDTSLTYEQKRFAEAIRSISETLLHYVSNNLNLSKLSSKSFKTAQVSFSLIDIVKRVCEAYAFYAEKRGIELTWWMHSDVESDVVGDPVHVSQIISNLLANAVKFTSKGSVFLEIKALKDEKPSDTEGADFRTSWGCSDGSRTVELLFSVSDTGIGVPPNRVNAIFERFTQADESITRNYGGTGIGLYVAKRLVEQMEGSIWVQSELNRGSTFFFTLRLKAQQSQPSHKTPYIQLTGKKVLIIDDNPINCMMLSDLLGNWGAFVRYETRGEEGLKEVKRALEISEPYSLVLLDSHMPEMNGIETARAICEIPGLSTPVILMMHSTERMTGSSGVHEGISDYVLKPIVGSDLKASIQKVLGLDRVPKDIRSESSSTLKSEKPNKLRILLADDSENIRLLIASFLNCTPHILEVVENGDMAFEKASKSQYDLILMDMNMSVTNGFRATERIRDLETKKGRKPVPIIALSAFSREEYEKKCMGVGCTDYINKPFKKEDLLSAINRCAG
jgi:CheY-like chemotaxis protein